jgi:hypothetical protein
VIYYLLRLLAAGGYLAAQLLRTRKIERAASAVSRWAAVIGPDVLALLTFLAGFVMLLGSAVPLAGDAGGREGLAGHGPGESCRGDFEVPEGDDVARMLPQLERIAAAWRARSAPRERGFCRACFNAPYVARLPAAVPYWEAMPMAFASLMTGAGREELGADLVRFLPDQGEEVLGEFLVRIGRWGAAQGYRWLDLGLGPGLGSSGGAHALVVGQLGALPYRYAEHFTDMTGLARFLDALHPQRQPRHLAVPPGFALPRVLHDIASMITTPAAKGRC